jgi:acyl carrier protein
MARSETMTIVVDSIREESGCPEEKTITDATTARDVPGWDSLAHVRIMLGIEMELDITVPIDSTYTVNTVGDLVNLVDSIVTGH